MVFLSEWLAIVAKRFLWSTYDRRLYVLPTIVVEWLRRLDLRRMLGGAERHEHLQALLDLHEAIDWLRVPYNQGHHFDNPRSMHYSPGRRYDADRADRRNSVRIKAGSLALAQPEYLQGDG